MPSIPNISFSVTFSLTGTPAIILTDTSTNGMSGSRVASFDITQPDGYTRNGNILSPDMPAGVTTFTIPMRLDSTGNVQCGTYNIVMTVRNTGYDDTTFTRNWISQYKSIDLNLENKFDIFTPVLIYNDATNYSVSNYTNTAASRSWVVSSIPTGTITGSSQSIDLISGGSYYDASYSISLTSSLTYTHTLYNWFTVQESITKTETADACTPESIDQLVSRLEALRVSTIDCSGDIPLFEKAQTLFSHLTDMIRLAIIGDQYQEHIYDVYTDLMAIFNVSCNHTNLPIPPYSVGDYFDENWDYQAAFCQNIGDGVNTTYTVLHNLNSNCVIVQVYEVSTNQQILCDIVISTANSVSISFANPPSTNQYKVIIHSGADHLKGREVEMRNSGTYIQWRYQGDVNWTNLVSIASITGPVGPGVASGGTAGQILSKIDGTNYNTEWIDNYTTDVREEVKAGEAINKGQAVYISDADGTNVIVSKASNDTEAKSSKTLGLLFQNLANNGTGFVITEGKLSGLNTTGAVAGDPVWLGTNGNIIYGLANKPVAPAHLVYIGVVTRVNANNGEIFVHVVNGFELQELHNVKITNPTNGQVLKYDSGTGLWVNSTDQAGTGTVTSVGLTSGTGILVSGGPITTSGTITVTNTAPDQTVVLTGAGTTSISGTYPSFTITSNDQYTGTVTSVGLTSTTSGVTIGSSPVIASGNITIDIATATNSQNGLLSSADWITFNSKQNSLPSQTGNNGKYLTTDGSVLSWASVDALPLQTGNNGKYLTTDGTTASWATISTTLSGLSDVQLNTPLEGQSLAYNGTKWTNQTPVLPAAVNLFNYYNFI